MPDVAVVRQSTRLSAEQAGKIASALEDQANQHICPAWGLEPVTVAVKTPGPADWKLVFKEDSDEEGALGYHRDQVSGLPVMEVFVRTCEQAGVSASSCASHELAEALADPNLSTANLDVKAIKFWATEIGDPAQASTYEVNGVEMQDFVTPAWFDSTLPSGAKFDHTGKITKPFEVPPGGYAQFLDLRHPGKGWQNVGMELGENGKAGHTRPGHRGNNLADLD